jgi:hypothetical protein
MLFLKYLCAVIAMFSTLVFITNLISDITIPSVIRAVELNVSEDKVTQYSAALRLILIILMSLFWPIIFVF